MHTITKFVATDGTEWTSAEACAHRDALDIEVRAIEARLPAVPDRSTERVMVAPAVVASAKAAVVELCRREFPSEPIFRHPPKDIHPMSYAGRFLDDVGGPLRRVWHWFMCERDGWVYQQPFFALNPEQWKEQP